MPFRICKIFEIENGHMLARHPDACRFPHGHSRRVEVVLEAETLDASGMVCDFKALRDAVAPFLDVFDHALCVNTDDPMFPALKQAYGERVIAFPSTEPTTEILAKTFFEEIRARLKQEAEKAGSRYPIRRGLRLVRVRVWETSTSWAEYYEGNGQDA